MSLQICAGGERPRGSAHMAFTQAPSRVGLTPIGEWMFDRSGSVGRLNGPWSPVQLGKLRRSAKVAPIGASRERLAQRRARNSDLARLLHPEREIDYCAVGDDVWTPGLL
jgi:hypothetical protein